jgi:hypothetical protein
MIELIKVDGVHNWHLHKPHWHLSRVAAVRQANEMRRSRIYSLRESLAKMEALNFDEENPA